MVASFVYLGSMIDSSGGSKREVLRRIGVAQDLNLLEKRMWKSSVWLDIKNVYIRPTVQYKVPVWCTVVKHHDPTRGTCAFGLTHLTHGLSASSLGFPISLYIEC